MEAGYDYLLLRGRLKRHLLGFPALFLIVLGVMLMAGGGAYYGYAAKARADLDQLNFTLSPSGDDISDPAGTSSAFEAVPAVIPPAPVIYGSTVAWQRDRPELGVSTTALWGDPLSYEPASLAPRVDLQAFTALDGPPSAPVGSGVGATRILVPGLGIDSSVQDLAILDLDDSRAYATPVNTVGHIPDSANPGEAGDSWFFGHLESPILGEGSVFYNLPRISEMLRNGEEVHVITDNGDQQYLYRITSTRVVHQDDLELEPTGQGTINLVACVPRLVYDHRLIVTGEMVGVQ